MSRAKSKPVTLDGIKHCSSQGAVETRACKDPKRRGYHINGIQKEDAITIEMNHCMAFMGRNEAHQHLVSVAHACKLQFGEEFLDVIMGSLEAMTGPE